MKKGIDTSSNSAEPKTTDPKELFFERKFKEPAGARFWLASLIFALILLNFFVRTVDFEKLNNNLQSANDLSQSDVQGQTLGVSTLQIQPINIKAIINKVNVSNGMTVSGKLFIETTARAERIIIRVQGDSRGETRMMYSGTNWGGSFQKWCSGNPSGRCNTIWDSTQHINGTYFFSVQASNGSERLPLGRGYQIPRMVFYRINVQNPNPPAQSPPWLGTPPMVNIMGPTHLSTISGNVAISSNVISQFNVSETKITVDDRLVKTCPGSNKQGDVCTLLSWDSRTVSNGEHYIAVYSSNQYGGVGNDFVRINVQNEQTGTDDFGSGQNNGNQENQGNTGGGTGNMGNTGGTTGSGSNVDLVVDYTMVDPSSPQMGSDVRLIGRGLNRGSASSGSNVPFRFRLDINSDGSWDRIWETSSGSSAIAALGTNTQSVIWNADTFGTHKFEVCADMDRSGNGIVTETNENNNCATRYFSIASNRRGNVENWQSQLSSLGINLDQVVLAASSSVEGVEGFANEGFCFDFDGDLKVTGADSNLVLANIGGRDLRYDVYPDGLVDMLDVLMVAEQQELGRVCLPSEIPTPVTSPTPTPTPKTIPKLIACPPLKIGSLTSPVYPGGSVVTRVQVNGSGCSGLTAWVYLKGLSNPWAKCTIVGSGCSTRHLAPKASGTYSILAVANLDRDGRWYESGEYDVKVLNVL